MRRCFELAKLGKGFVSPNPLVGAVLVHDDVIIGEGYHAQYGAAHAEVNCLNSVAEKNKHLIPKSTLYVSLEPCAHYGKTPPCADLIVQQKIPKVYISVVDNFDLVNGKGIEHLQKNGVQVVSGILEDEGMNINKHYWYFLKNKMPYITLKFAQTNDGYIGIQNKKIRISDSLAQRYTHQLRAEHQSILVGKNTVLSDNPKLDVRFATGKSPLRLVLGNETDIPKDFHIKNGEPSTIFISDKSKLSIQEVLQKIADHKIISVLIEGGADVLQQFIAQNVWNEAHIITNKNTLLHRTQDMDNPIKAPCIKGIETASFMLDTDHIQVLKNPHAISFT